MPRFLVASAAASIALIAVIFTGGDGGGSTLGLIVLFVPILIVVALVACLFVGAAFLLGYLSLLLGSAREWWVAHGWLSVVIGVVGLTMSALSRVIATSEIWFDEEGFSHVQYNSPPLLLFGGILLLTFGVLWLPRRQRDPLAA